MAQTTPIRIGTRGSKLALRQANLVRDALAAAHDLPPETVEIVAIRTSGDRVVDRPLAEAGGKGLFTKEIEDALLSESVDLAVHSAKDMPTFLPEGLVIGSFLEREDVRDALVSHSAATIEDLPRGARIGTASPRREALVRRARPDVEIALLRGNVPTRLSSVEAGAFDATLLAAAGLRRLGLDSHISALLSVEAFPPACGQGAIAIECREGDMGMRDMLAPINHPATAAALSCERAFLAVLDGSCRTPIAGYARLQSERLHFTGILLAQDGREFYETSGQGAVIDAAAIGREAGHDIRRRAPEAFLRRLGIA